MVDESNELTDRHRLNSWKEIAQHFSRDVRTVQRWEKLEGMPVQRHFHGPGSSVYAFVDELDRWGQARSKRSLQKKSLGRRKRWLILGGLGALMAAVFPIVLLTGVWRLPSSAGPTFPYYVTNGTPEQVGTSLECCGDLGGWRLRITNGDLLGNIDIGDFNGDGSTDLLAGVSHNEVNGYFGTAANYLLLGDADAAQPLSLPKSADVEIRLDHSPDARLGPCLLQDRSNDLDGDGLSDALFAAPEYKHAAWSSGGVFFIRGRRQWPSEIRLPQDADRVIGGSRMGEGLWLCAVGDFDGNGQQDLAVFANEATLWNYLGGSGRVYVFLSFLEGEKKFRSSKEATLTFACRRPKAHVTAMLMQDLNGDGRDDLVLSIPRFDDGSDFPGEVRIWYGFSGMDGTLDCESPDVAIRGSGPRSEFGWGLSAYDLDRDGLQELLITEPGSGRLIMIQGRRKLASGRINELSPTVLFDRLDGQRERIFHISDVDRDCLAEVILSAPRSLLQRDEREPIWVVKPYLPLQIDVRPEAEPNVMVPNGISAVRVLGSPTLNDLDAETILLSGSRPVGLKREDFNQDGHEDLQAYFRNDLLGLGPGASCVSLTVRSRQGWLFGGSDKIEVPVPPR